MYLYWSPLVSSTGCSLQIRHMRASHEIFCAGRAQTDAKMSALQVVPCTASALRGTLKECIYGLKIVTWDKAMDHFHLIVSPLARHINTQSGPTSRKPKNTKGTHYLGRSASLPPFDHITRSKLAG